MKKLIFGTAAILVVAFGVVAFKPAPISPVTPITLAVPTAMVTEPCPCMADTSPMPYCGTCEEEGKEAKPACIAACEATLDGAKAAACVTWHTCIAAADAEYNERRNRIFATYTSCINGGGNPAGCKAARDAALAAARAEWDNDIGSCSSAACTAIDTARAAWVVCVTACCLECDPTSAKE
jgi:hypothetical protein